MKILFATSEAVPFIKSGGLADVSGSLARALRGHKQTCRVVMPLYEDIEADLRKTMKPVTTFEVQLGWRRQYCGVFEATAGNVKYYFIDNEYYFRRRGLYGFYDDAERFAFFSRAVLEMLEHIDFAPEVIHCNDWQTAMIPVYLNTGFRWREKYKNLKTVFTIHNIQYQGSFPKDVHYDVLGLMPGDLHILELGESINLMKGAIEEAEAITTVSPSYAEEILDPWFAHGLDSFLRHKQYKLTGILNGLDYSHYDPKTDDRIKENYTPANLAGKAANKRELQSSLGLSKDPDAMIIGMVGRLVGHKGLDLIQYAFGRMLRPGVQFVLLGAGDWKYEKFLREAEVEYPGRVSVTLGFDEVLAHKIYAGADVFLMPSKSEPCGLAQMIALRYGTIPVVRSTGGLRDTIVDMGAEDGTGNGYTFLTYNADDMLYALERAQGDFLDADLWKGHVQRAMKCDFSWGKSADAYIALYQKLVE